MNVQLDPASPYLADHRPNGRPLLGTVASLDILAEAASVFLGDVPRRIAAVDIVSPLIFASEEPRSVRIACREIAAGIVECVLESETARHLSCHFAAGAPDDAPRRPAQVPGPNAIDRSDIYRLFFHGPAFQVVAAAEWRDGTLVARLNTALPPWHLDGRPAPSAPRLVEFALQSAGLLALAEQPEMAIPRHIARIERFLPADERVLPILFAAAARDGDAIGIDLFDAEGRVHLRVTGYLTAALPYPVGQDRMDALHEALRR